MVSTPKTDTETDTAAFYNTKLLENPTAMPQKILENGLILKQGVPEDLDEFAEEILDEM